MYLFKFIIYLNILIFFNTICYANYDENKNESNINYVEENLEEFNIFKYEKIFKTCCKLSNEKPYIFNFYVSNNMKDIKINFNLSFMFSNTAIEDISSITIYCNNIPINSYNLETIKNLGILSCILNSNYLENGNNVISIKCNIKSSKNNFELNEEINWAVIEKYSKIEISYKLSDIDFISNLFKNTYYIEDDISKTMLVIPNNLSNFDYTILSTLSCLLGNYYKSYTNDFKLEISNYTDLPFIKHSSIIIGKYNEIKNFFPYINFKDYESKNFINLSYNNDNNISFLSIQKIGNISHLFLIINNEEDLINFTNIFSNKLLYEDLNTKNYLLTNSQENFITKSTFKINETIKSLGYNNETIKGENILYKEYNFPINNKKLYIDKNYFKFYFNYSEKLACKNSYITIYINEEPIKTQKLTLKKSNNDSISFSIPKNLTYKENYKIKLVFYLEDKKLFNNISENNWVNIDVEKSIYKIRLKERKIIPLFLSNSLIENNLGEIDGIILVDNLDNINKEIYANFCSYLGNLTNRVNILKLEKSKEIPKNFSGFIIGIYESDIIKNISDKLNLKLKNNDKNISLIDIINKKNILVITSKDKNQLNLAMKCYTNGFSKNDLQTIIKDGKQILKIEENNINNLYLSKIIKNININKIDLIIIIYSIIIISILLLLYIYIYKKKK